MGFLSWLFGKKALPQDKIPSVVVRVELITEPSPPVKYARFSTTIEGSTAIAEVPVEAKAKCERLLAKPNLTDDDLEYLHENYWVNVHYRGHRHGYQGVKDLWTYTARELPELPMLHDWIYSVLGTIRAEVIGDIKTTRVWEEGGAIHARGQSGSMSLELSFKPKGYVVSLILSDKNRFPEKATYNTRTGVFDGPFYFSTAQTGITGWARDVFEKNRPPRKNG